MRKLWAIVIWLVVCSSFPTFHNAADAGQKQREHLVPADKNLSQAAMQRLFERGSEGPAAAKTSKPSACRSAESVRGSSI